MNFLYVCPPPHPNDSAALSIAARLCPACTAGVFYSARSVRKAMGPLESPKSENPLRKQRAF